MSRREEKIEVNKKMIGTTVRVEEKGEQWVGCVESVKDEETVVVRDLLNCIHEVSIFDIRSI